MNSQNMVDRSLDTLNSPWYKNMFLCYSDIAVSTFDFFQKIKGYNVAMLPVTTGSISSPMGLGSDSIPVKINLLGNDTYLADSMQFLLEYSLRFQTPGVFYLMPTFRGEDPDERHLSQFYHAESEIVGSLYEMMEICEHYVKYMSSIILKKSYYQEAVALHKVSEVSKIIALTEFPRIRFFDAVKLLEKNCIDGIELKNGIININSIGEKWLISHFEGVVWLTHFEHKSVPFYQAYDKDNPRYSLSADLLIGMGETIGCGQRADYLELLKSLEEHQVEKCNYEWYINMKKHLPLKTSGFGLGVERFIAWLFGVSDIRKVPYIYRSKGMSVFP